MSIRKTIYFTLNLFDQHNEMIPLLLKQVFKKYSIILKKDKIRISVCVNEIIRYQGLLDHLIEKGSKKKISHINYKIRNILRLGIYELVFDDIIPEFAAIHSNVELAKKYINKKSSSLVNAVLRNIQRFNHKNENWKMSLVLEKAQLSYPSWLLKKWESEFGKVETKNLCIKFLNEKKMYIRLNSFRLDLNEMVYLLKLDNIDVIQHNHFKDFFKVISGQKDILRNDLFLKGIISIQDPASGAVVELVDPQKNDFILDVCAAPGTKSLLMAQRVGKNGRIFASDISQKRINKSKNDILRHNMKNIHWSLLDATKDIFPLHEKILIDAPCSGTGVIGRRPDIKWRLKESDVQKMARLQLSILENISKYLKPGGQIVYSTCSLEKEENEGVIKRFLKKRSDFYLDVSDSLLPDEWVTSEGFMFSFPTKTNTDGLFAAKLQKKN